MMNSYDDSDSANETQTHEKIMRLIKLRKKQRCGVRRLYDDISTAARRSLNVQIISQKDGAKVSESSVFEEEEIMALDNNIQKSPLVTPTTRLQRQSMVCSTPKTRDLTKKFVSSLSPVNCNSERSISEILKNGILNQNQQGKNPLSGGLPSKIKSQPQVVLRDVLNRTKIRKTADMLTKNLLVPNTIQVDKSQSKDKSVEQELMPSPRITRTNLTKLNLTKVSKLNSELQSNSSLSETASVNPNHGSSITKTAKSVSNENNSKEASKYTIPVKKQLLRELSSTAEIGDSEVIPETQGEYDEMEYGTSVPAKQLEPLQVDQVDSPLTSTSTSSNTVTQSISNTKEMSRSRRPTKNKKKGKISESYLSFLNLEKSVKRKSIKAGSKRKLYSSEQEFQKLLEPRDDDSDSTTRRSRNFKVSPEKIHVSVFDSDGFKVPNTACRTIKLTRNGYPIITSEFEVVDENIRILNKSRTNVVPNQTLQIENVTKKTTPQKAIAKPKSNQSKPSRKAMIENDVAEQANEMRRSNRVRHEPMTFWKVHKEPITDFNHKFYKHFNSESKKRNNVKSSENKEIRESQPSKVQEDRVPTRTLRSASKKRNKIKRHPLPEIVEPVLVLEECLEPGLNNVKNVEQPEIVEENQILQITQIELQEPRSPPRPFTSVQRTTKERHISDSAFQITTESEDQTNPHTRFLKKFGTMCISEEFVQQSNEKSTLISGNDFLNIGHIEFQEFTDVSGLDFAFVPNTNQMVGFMKLQPHVHKRESRTSRKYYLTLMLFTDSSISIKINQKTMEMILGGLDSIQLPPDSRYELTNNSTKPAILMLVRTRCQTMN